ncbi:MAG: ArsI/CadI family heavy metal resistance metalloenzyme, partial [Candidatus Nanopelagicales bacterium]
MSKVQLALNVAHLAESIDFYSQMFRTEPHKIRPGYANFQIDNPPLKLVLIETTGSERGTGPHGALNHLGVEVPNTSEVVEIISHLHTEGLAVEEQMDVQCCHAKQDKAWVHDPSGTPWEFYAITDDNSDGM